MVDAVFSKNVSMLVYCAGGQNFGIQAETVLEILRMKEVHVFKVPKMTPGVLGIMNLRGDIIPVLNFNERFNYMNGEVLVTPFMGTASRLIVVSLEGVLYGFLVEAVLGIYELDTERFEAEYLVGVEFRCLLEGATLQITKLDELIA